MSQKQYKVQILEGAGEERWVTVTAQDSEAASVKVAALGVVVGEVLPVELGDSRGIDQPPPMLEEVPAKSRARNGTESKKDDLLGRLLPLIPAVAAAVLVVGLGTIALVSGVFQETVEFKPHHPDFVRTTGIAPGYPRTREGSRSNTDYCIVGNYNNVTCAWEKGHGQYDQVAYGFAADMSTRGARRDTAFWYCACLDVPRSSNATTVIAKYGVEASFSSSGTLHPRVEDGYISDEETLRLIDQWKAVDLPLEARVWGTALLTSDSTYEVHRASIENEDATSEYLLLWSPSQSTSCMFFWE